jgi:hypothetical protein
MLFFLQERTAQVLHPPSFAAAHHPYLSTCPIIGQHDTKFAAQAKQRLTCSLGGLATPIIELPLDQSAVYLQVQISLVHDRGTASPLTRSQGRDLFRPRLHGLSSTRCSTRMFSDGMFFINSKVCNGSCGP